MVYKQRRLNRKTRQTVLKLELQRRRTEAGSTRAEKLSSLDEVSKNIAASVIQLKPKKKKVQPLEKSHGGEIVTAAVEKSGQRIYGLAKHLEDAALDGHPGSYKKNTHDPPEAVVQPALPFGSPLIINRSQVSELEKNRSRVSALEKKRSQVFDLEKNRSQVSELERLKWQEEGDLMFERGVEFGETFSYDASKEESWIDDNICICSIEPRNNRVLCQLERRQYMQICFVSVILAFAVAFTLAFSNENEISAIITAPLDDRFTPTRPSPPLPPVFDKSRLPHTKKTTEYFDNNDLKKVIQEIANEHLLEGVDTPQGKAFKWIQSYKLDGMGIARLEQRYILAVLYFQFEAETWNVEYGWLSSKHECTWHGVRCGSDATSSSTDRKLSSADENLAESVTYLNLSENNLHGKLPEDLKYLTNLAQLILSKNFIQGTIPPGLFSNFQSMHTLYLDENYITGQVPDDLGHLLLLRNLDLHDNSLRATIPATINFLTDLVDVRLQNNEFYGDIPDVFDATSSLRVFLAGNNEIKSIIPASLAGSLHLEALHLHENVLHGSIPEFLSKELRQLHLDGNSLEGPIPPSLVVPSSSALEELRLENNKLSGAVPDSVCLLKTEHKLKYLTAVCEGSTQDISCDCCDPC